MYVLRCLATDGLGYFEVKSPVDDKLKRPAFVCVFAFGSSIRKQLTGLEQTQVGGQPDTICEQPQRTYLPCSRYMYVKERGPRHGFVGCCWLALLV